MLINLSKDYNLRGYTLEYTARILTRRNNKNNFIFQSCRFDDAKEIVKKYRMTIPEKIQSLFNTTNNNWNKCDLVEFKLNNNKDRIIEDINFYEVKTKFHKVERDYFEICKYNYKFFKELVQGFSKDVNIISITLFENWRFSYNIRKFTDSKVRVFSNYKG